MFVLSKTILHKHKELGNCDICTELKKMVMNETKRIEPQSRPKVWVQKIFQALLPNFGMGYNKSCQKFHPLCMAWTKVTKFHFPSQFSKNLFVFYRIKQKL
jgi:hypothetical protein